MAKHNQLGKKGEEESIHFLLSQSYQILEKNYRYDRAEIDIIAKKDDLIIFVEVKTRSSPFYGNPEDFVSEAQQKRIVKAASHYIEEKQIDMNFRFDIIAIINHKELLHFEDAFYPIEQ